MPPDIRTEMERALRVVLRTAQNSGDAAMRSEAARAAAQLATVLYGVPMTTLPMTIYPDV